MPTTTATEGPKPDHGLLDWNFLTLMDDGFTCGPDVATYSLAERLLCELGGLERAMGAALVFDRGSSTGRWTCSTSRARPRPCSSCPPSGPRGTR